MRLLHVVPTYIPAYRYGGPIYSVHGLCKALAARDHDVHVFTTNINGPDNSDVPIDTPVDIDGVKVWYFSSPLLRRLYWSPSMNKALKKRIKQFNLVHLHSIFLWPIWAAARAARTYNVPYILAPRGMLVKTLIKRKSRLSKSICIKFFERYNLEQAAGIHVTTKAEGRECNLFGFKLPVISVVPNGIDSTEFSNNPVEPSDVVKHLLTKQPMVLFLSRISWKKGLDRLIPAFALVPDAHLIIAGNDDENYSPYLANLARTYGAEQRVNFIGQVRSADKIALFKAAKVFVLPSYSENFGNVVLEAMAMGCPVIVTPEVGLADTVLETRSGIVSDGSPEQLGTEIKHLLENNKLRREMGESGLIVVRERFGWHTVAKNMEEVYMKILRGEKFNPNA